MQFVIFFSLLFFYSTFAIPVSNTGPGGTPPNKSVTTQISTNPPAQHSTPWFLSLKAGTQSKYIQDAIDLCQHRQSHFLGRGLYGAAWKVDLGHKGVFALKVIKDIIDDEDIIDKEIVDEEFIAKELHNLRRVGQLVEWGEITKDGEPVFYILMHYMGMTSEELLKNYSNILGNRPIEYVRKLMENASNLCITEHGMQHDDVGDNNMAFRVESHHGEQVIVGDLIDWGLATDLREHIPTKLNVKELLNSKRVVVDNVDWMGEFEEVASVH